MKEQIQKINQMVAEGKLSPEDAADLIETMIQGAGTSNAQAGSSTQPKAPPKDPLSGFFQELEKFAREGKDSVDWAAMSSRLKEGVKKGREAVREAVDELSKGKLNVGFLTAEETRSFDLPLMVPAGKSLRIDNPTGRLKISGGHQLGSIRGEVEMRAASLEEAKAKLAQYQLIVEETEHMIVIRQPEMTGLACELTIQLNGHCGLEVRGETGDIQIENTGGPVRISTRSGDISLNGANGVIEISAESGDISIGGCQTPSLSMEIKSGDISLVDVIGTVNARSASGNMSATNMDGKVLSLETVSGDLSVSSILPINNVVNLRTVSGDVSLTVPASSNARVALSTLRGEISADVDLSDRHETAQRVTGTMGSGGGQIDVSAVTGDISISLISLDSE
jgi:hypothetical protein